MRNGLESAARRPPGKQPAKFEQEAWRTRPDSGQRGVAREARKAGAARLRELSGAGGGLLNLGCFVVFEGDGPVFAAGVVGDGAVAIVG